MSWFVRCDRCKKEIKKYPDEGMTLTRKGPNKKEHTIHLCPDCAESFYYWENKIDPNDPMYMSYRR